MTKRPKNEMKHRWGPVDNQGLQVCIKCGGTMKFVRGYPIYVVNNKTYSRIAPKCEHPPNIKERLESKVMPEPMSGCWIWIACVNPRSGYGQITIDGACVKAHRVSYKEYKGDPTGYLVLHDCDNRFCINPDHLYLGTSQDNADDAIRRGRAARGERIGSSKMDTIQILTIRDCLSSGIPSKELCRYFKTDSSQISRIKNGKIWGHVKATV